MEKIIFVTKERIRLDEFLRREMPLKILENISNSKIRRLIISSSVYVNNKIITKPAFELRGNSKIIINFDREKFFYEKQPDDIDFEVKDDDILFEDENLIFINKPAFFPVEQTITKERNNLHDSLVQFLWKRNPNLKNPPYVGIMHRLDRGTSGVILFTKNRAINKEISELFQSHNLEKKYLAVVEEKKYKIGSEFCVEMFMGRISGKSQVAKWGKLSEGEGGVFSKTKFKILKSCKIEGKNCFLVECVLFTGRTHQIRVHLSSVGLPILGDELYGGKSAKRIYLHSSKLSAKTENLDFDVNCSPNFESNFD